MKHIKWFLWTGVLLGLLLAGCDPAEPSLRIVPDDCELLPSEKIAFSLQGSQPPGKLSYTWTASDGSIIGLSNGVTAEYTAPSTAGTVTITLIASNGEKKWPVTRDCQIVTPEPVPETVEYTPAATDASPDLTSTPLPTPTGSIGKVIISEVMVNVCGGEDYKRFNQYIELYNTGDVPIDADGLWIYSPNSDYRGQRLVAWNTRNPDFKIPGNLTLNSTVIPPHGVAVILPPQYGHAPRPYNMPYAFPDGTVILTVANDIRLGDHFYAIRAEQGRLDVVILYEGGETAMHGLPISTYGTPRINSKYLRDVYDNGEDGLPLIPSECFSAERINPNLPDEIHNWHTVYGGSPGEYIP